MRREERLEQCLILAVEVGKNWQNTLSIDDAEELLDQMEDLRSAANGELTADEYREDWGL